MNDTRPIVQELSFICRKLRLSQTVVQRAREIGHDEQLQFLAQLLEAELEQRRSNRISRLMNLAGFPGLKSWDDFDFQHVQLPALLNQEELRHVSFIESKQNLIHYGPVGTGKTHLAIAMGVEACKKDYAVRFFTVSQLVLKLGEAHRTGTLEKLILDLQRVDLLILDEWGYVPLDRQGSQLLFRVISDSYEQRSLILTTNLEFSKWGTIFTDQQMAAAMIDRLVHHGHLLLFEGPSHRMSHALMRGVVMKTG